MLAYLEDSEEKKNELVEKYLHHLPSTTRGGDSWKKSHERLEIDVIQGGQNYLSNRI